MRTPTTTAERPTPPAVPEREVNFQSLRGVSGILATLEAFRETTGTSKAELARRLDLQREAISRLLSPGDTNPEFKTLVRLLAGLGLHMDITIRETTPEDEYIVTVAGEFDGQRRTAGDDY